MYHTSCIDYLVIVCLIEPENTDKTEKKTSMWEEVWIDATPGNLHVTQLHQVTYM